VPEIRHYAHVRFLPELDDTSPMGLVHALTSSSPERRRAAAGAITDLVHDLSADDVALLVHVLVAARVVEPDDECQEAELHALGTLDEWHQVSDEVLARLRFLPAESVVGSQVEYLESLLDDRA
jgi:hypothetical protein